MEISALLVWLLIDWIGKLAKFSPLNSESDSLSVTQLKSELWASEHSISELAGERLRCNTLVLLVNKGGE